MRARCALVFLLVLLQISAVAGIYAINPRRPFNILLAFPKHLTGYEYNTVTNVTYHIRGAMASQVNPISRLSFNGIVAGTFYSSSVNVRLTDPLSPGTYHGKIEILNDAGERRTEEGSVFTFLFQVMGVGQPAWEHPMQAATPPPDNYHAKSMEVSTDANSNVVLTFEMTHENVPEYHATLFVNGHNITQSKKLRTSVVIPSYALRTDEKKQTVLIYPGDEFECPAGTGSYQLFEIGNAVVPPISEADEARDLYMDLMRDTVTNMIYMDLPYATDYTNAQPLEDRMAARFFGLDHPMHAHTMVGTCRLDTQLRLMKDVVKRGIPGDFIETGSWRGGACIYMRAFLKAYKITDRKVFVCDSFKDSSAPSGYGMDKGLVLPCFGSYCNVTVESVKDNFRRYGLLDEQVEFVEGMFSDTMPVFAPSHGPFAILRLDGDYYESTWVVLEHLYPRLSPGGYVVIDDYTIRQCRKAVWDYLEKFGEEVELLRIGNGMAVYWQKPLFSNVPAATPPAGSKIPKAFG